MSQEPEHNTNIMTAVSLLDNLAESGVRDDFEIWLSSDEEGNEILPVLADPKCSLAIEEDGKKVILFPSHR